MNKKQKLIVFVFFGFGGIWILINPFPFNRNTNLSSYFNFKNPTQELKTQIEFKKKQALLVKSTFASDENKSAFEATKRFILENNQKYPIQEYHQLKGEIITTPMGALVSYKVFQEDLPVIGMQLDFRVSRTGKVSEVFNGYRPISKIEPSVTEKLSLNRILRIQESDYQLAEGESTSQEKALIWVTPGSSFAQLGYVVSVVSKTKPSKVPEQAIFSVTTGQLLARELSRSEFDNLK